MKAVHVLASATIALAVGTTVFAIMERKAESVIANMKATHRKELASHRKEIADRSLLLDGATRQYRDALARIEELEGIRVQLEIQKAEVEKRRDELLAAKEESMEREREEYRGLLRDLLPSAQVGKAMPAEPAPVAVQEAPTPEREPVFDPRKLKNSQMREIYLGDGRDDDARDIRDSLDDIEMQLQRQRLDELNQQSRDRLAR